MTQLCIYHPWAGLRSRRVLYQEMAKQLGWKLSFIVPQSWLDEYGREVVPEQPADDVIPVHLVGSGNIPLHAVRQRIAPVLSGCDPDLLYVYHEPYALATWQNVQAGYRKNIPTGVRSSQNILKHYPQPFRTAEAIVYRRAAFAVVVSPAVADVLRDKGFQKPIHVVPMAVDTQLFGSKPDPVRDGPARVGFVGRLVFEKGLELALRAVAAMRTQGDISVVGAGPELHSMQRLAEHLGVGVTWHGTLAPREVAEVLRSVDLVVVPSRRTSRWVEQFGRVVLEAASSGTPVLTSDSGELPNVVALLEAGWTFPEDNLLALTNKLDELLSDREALVAVGARAGDVVRATLSEPAVARQLAAALSNYV